MSIITEITESHTPVEVIPVLTADNLKEVRENCVTRATPTAFLKDGGKLFSTDAITTADGEDTVWRVSGAGDHVWLESNLPCSIPKCDGHLIGDLTDDWEDFSHEVLAATLPTPGVGTTGQNYASLTLSLRGNKLVVDYYSYVEGELRVDQIDDLIAQLEATIAAAKEFRAASILESEFVDEK